MNMAVSEVFGKTYGRLPLKAAAKILNTDALAVDWETLVAKSSLSYILGNPPFIGSKLMKAHQRAAIGELFGGSAGSGNLDYVAGWYIKAAEFIQGTPIKVGFVSTNSIVQGEQTSVLWGRMLDKYKVTIHFAHRTFKWSNEARGKAAVFCVIIGFASFDTSSKWLFDYEDIKGGAHKRETRNINPYLVAADNVLIGSRSNPLCTVPKMSFGNMPLDGGNLILADDEKTEFLEQEPNAEKFIRPLISAKEFLNGGKRWCFWLVGAEPSEVRNLPELMKRIEAVRKFRLASDRAATSKRALTPSLFGEIRDFGSTYIVVPRHSSENRAYIPMGFFEKDSIVSDSCMAIPNGNLFHFGVLMSQMHMAWVRHVCGRIKSDFRYSKDIVYNNYPWPSSPTERQIEAVRKAAQSVLDARLAFPKSSLADLYHPSTMPQALVKAHTALDKAVDACYSGQTFATDASRMELLFSLYGSLSQPLLPISKVKGKGKKK
jgi:hypothetical protein